MRHLVFAAAIAVSTIGVAGTSSAADPAPTATVYDDTPWTLPVTPPTCTVRQADSGDVGDCLLKFYRDPADIGFGQPPDPGVGDGWDWQGYWYNGSPALANWETTWIAANDEPVAGIAAGQLETHRAAQELFEGFLREISENGYRVYGASGYSFRCTSGNGGWNCPSGDADDLSNHAWGLAIDMNAGTNPIRSYTGIDGASACLTPIQTDMPRWVIQTAEKWGLYWGGYGWNSGCADTTTERTVVYRDPPHFEFRGTPDQARAIAEFNLLNNPTTTCVTLVDDDGDDTEHCSRSTRPEAGWRVPVELTGAIPSFQGAAAAVVNLTATGAASPGFLTLESCDARSPGPRTTSSVTFDTDETVATMGIVALDDADRFCIYHSTDVHSIVDVVALVDDGEAAEWFRPGTPTRLLDTRTGPGAVPDQGVRGVPTTDGATRLANLAVIEGAGPGFLQAGSCDIVGPGRSFSNLNYLGGHVRSNLALMPAGETGSCVYALRAVQVIVDEVGVLDPDEGLGWAMTPTRRVLDTRRCDDAWCDDRPGGATMIELDLGTDAAAAAIAVTVTDTAAPGFVSVARCEDFDGNESPSTSNLNHTDGQTVTNLAVSALSDGRMCVYTHAPAHIVIDVQAELVDDHDLGIVAVDPIRVHDSR